MRRAERIRLLLPVLALLGAAGCGTVQGVLGGKPTARVTDVRFADLSLESLGLILDVEVSNPYGVAMPILGLEYALSSRGESFLSGKSAVSGTIPAQGSRTLPVRADLRFVELLRVLVAVRPGSLVPYAADLELALDAPEVGRLALPIHKEGELPVPAVPDLSVERIEWRKLDLDAAQAVLHLRVKNTNAFPFTLASLDYALSLGGHGVVSAELVRSTRFAAGGTQTLEIPFSVSPVALGLAAYGVFRGRDASYLLEGALATTTPFGDLRFPYAAKGTTPLVR